MEAIINMKDNVKIDIDNKNITVVGPNATLKRTFSNPRITISKKDNDIIIKTESNQKKDKAIVGAWEAHLKNMISGAQKDYEYKLKILYTHFPVTLKAQDNTIIITNFMGEKGIRKAHIKENVKVDIKKEEIIITGPSKENVGQTAANLEQACKQKTKDIRIYQDGIYITKKG
ncbi:MAG: 50S ribosomal protein L6 [archaeon]